MSRPINRMRAVPPGEVLREDYLAPLALGVLAWAMGVGGPAARMRRPPSPLTAGRSRWLGCLIVGLNMLGWA